MSLLKRYFDTVTYSPRYLLGDRVQGRLGKIPFRGTVANDTKISDDQPATVAIFLDLPIVLDSVMRSVIIVSHEHVKPLLKMKDTV